MNETFKEYVLSLNKLFLRLEKEENIPQLINKPNWTLLLKLDNDNMNKENYKHSHYGKTLNKILGGQSEWSI